MTTSRPHSRAAPNPAVAAFKATRGEWIHVAIFSTAVNFLMLTGSLYMLQVYDRVLASRSIPTLIGLSLIALLAFMLQGALDAFRLQILCRIGARFDEVLSPLTARAAVLLPMQGAKPAEALQPMRDLESVRSFLSSLGPTALIDMPFMPLFLFGCFLLHPWLCALALLGAVISVGLTMLNASMTAAPSKVLARTASERASLVESGRRNSEVITALGMGQSFAKRFEQVHERFVGHNLRLADVSGTIGAVAKGWRYVLQSAVLGLGAYLVIRGEMSGGAMLAASVLTSRALAPVDLAVANWKGFSAARSGFEGLKQQLPKVATVPKTLDLPAPRETLRLNSISVTSPGSARLIVQGVSFELKAGTALGLIGPSGSGKSTMARAIVGAWPVARGEVRLDGALLNQWDPVKLGKSIGYLPQDVELFEGTIAENIARFDPQATSATILDAARTAGAHDMIIEFSEGYDTRIGDGATALSGGQRQRIALARALYGDPFLVVLDEPNASLDAAGDRALSGAIRATAQRGGIVIVITHRPSGLREVDLVGVMSGGKLEMIGPRDEVLTKAVRGAPTPQQPQPAAEPAGAQRGEQFVDALKRSGFNSSPGVAANIKFGPAPEPGSVVVGVRNKA